MDQVQVGLITQKSTDKDELFICPFDPVHRISAKRYVYHIAKCRKNYPHLETATCPFNARHIVLKPELRYHTSVCPDSGNLELELASLDTSEPPNDHLASSSKPDFGDDEDWDEEIERNKHRNVVDPLASGDEGFTVLTNHVKKTNTRRETIKRLKERLRQEFEAKGQFPLRQAELESDAALRRPDFAAGARAKVFAASVASISTKSDHQSSMQEDGLLPSSLMRAKPRLAANFSMPPKVPVGVGRGRAMQLANGTDTRCRATQREEKDQDDSDTPSWACLFKGTRVSSEDTTDPLGAADHVDWGFEVVQSRRKKKRAQK